MGFTIVIFPHKYTKDFSTANTASYFNILMRQSMSVIPLEHHFWLALVARCRFLASCLSTNLKLLADTGLWGCNDYRVHTLEYMKSEEAIMLGNIMSSNMITNGICRNKSVVHKCLYEKKPFIYYHITKVPTLG